MAKGYGMWDVLRSHAIGKLEREDPETLKEFQTVIGARIKAIDNALEHTNHFKHQAEELKENLKWFAPIRDQIGQLLTRELHEKAV